MKVYERIKSELKSGNKVSHIFSTPNLDYNAKLIITPVTGDDKITKSKISGYAVEAATSKQIPDTHIRDLANNDINNIEISIAAAINKITGKLPKSTKDSESTKATRIDKPYSSAIAPLRSEVLAHNFPCIHGSTVEHAFTYLLRFAKSMDKLSEPIAEDDLKKIVDEFVEKAYRSGHGKYNKNGVVNKYWQGSKNGVMQRLKHSEEVYCFILEAHPELNLPRIKFPLEPRVLAIKREQLKYLPNDVRVRLAVLIEEEAKKGEELAFGTGGMFYGAYRTAEAAAPLIGEFDLFHNSPYGRYYVQAQIKGKDRTRLLKTPDAYRYTPAVSALCKLVRMKKDKLENLGYTEAEIISMPFVADQKDLKMHIDPQKLSAYVLRLLKQAGCTEAFLAEAERQMHEEPEFDEKGDIILDLSAYILRRDWCSRACNICGLTPDEADYYLGHKNRNNTKREYGSDEVIIKIARKLERYVANPATTTNPAFAPVEVNCNVDYSLCGNGAYRFRATKRMELLFDVSAMEPNNPIIIRHNGQLYELVKRAPIDTVDDRQNRAVIGKLYNVEYYEAIFNAMTDVSQCPEQVAEIDADIDGEKVFVVNEFFAEPDETEQFDIWDDNNQMLFWDMIKGD